MQHRLDNGAAILAPPPVMRPEQFPQRRFCAKTCDAKTVDQTPRLDANLLQLFSLERFPYGNHGRSRIVTLLDPLQFLGHPAELLSEIDVGYFETPHRLHSTPSNLPSSAVIPESVLGQTAAVLILHTYDEHNRVTAQGSGFITGQDGICVTNYHVLSDASRAEAKLGDGRLYQVLRVHAYDRERDVLVFQLGRIMEGRAEWPTDLPFLALSDSAGPKVGERIATISSPEGLSNTVADGIISAIRRGQNQEFIQITAPISEGSSGGPVMDFKGNVIGMATLQIEGGQNLNFAIPVQYIKELLSRRDNLTFAEFHRVTSPPRTQTDPFTMNFSRGVALYNEGRYSEALERFLEAEQLRPDEGDAYYNAALCYQRLADEESAANEYYVYLLLSPADDPEREFATKWLKARGRPLPKSKK